MALGVRTIAIRFIGDTKDLQKAGKEGEKALGRWQSSLKKLDKFATGALVGLGGAIAGAVTNFIQAGDEIATTAAQMGIGTTALQELRFWAQQNDIEMNSLTRAVGNLNTRIGEAIHGNQTYADAFKLLGVELQDAQGNVRSTEDILKDTIRSLREMEDPSLQAGAAAQVFGSRIARELLPALQDGSLSLEEAAERAHELGFVMDEEAVEAAGELDNAINELKTIGIGLMRDFAVPFVQILKNNVLPVVQNQIVPALSSMSRFLSQNRGVVLAVVTVLGSLAAAIKVVTTVTKIWGVVTAMTPLGAIIAAVAALTAGIVFLATQTTFFQDLWETVWEAIKTAAEAVGRWFSETLWGKWIKGSFDSIRNGIAGVAKWIGDKWNGVMEEFRKVPGKLKEFFSKVKDFITAPFRTAFNFISDAWNNTVGQLQWTVPDWVPGIGGRTVGAPKLPKFHNGGVVPGPPGAEVPILARAGETVLPTDRGAVVIENHIEIGGEVVRVVRSEISLDKAFTRRRVRAGAGAFA